MCGNICELRDFAAELWLTFRREMAVINGYVSNKGIRKVKLQKSRFVNKKGDNEHFADGEVVGWRMQHMEVAILM